jgi:hypothetical protein
VIVMANLRRAKYGNRSQPHAELLFQVKAVGLPEPKVEWQFLQTRRFRFDLAWPYIVAPLGVEVDGGTWNGGRHVRGKGYESDCEKLALAMLHGWRVIKATSGQVKSGQAIGWIQELLRDERRAHAAGVAAPEESK